MIQKNRNGIIRYITRPQIDKEKWDACILSSSLPLIYATATYLDGMCRHWDALVLDDYDMVMPLPWNRKWWISYVYSPYFVVAGGVFGKEVTESILPAFIKAIPKRFLLVDLDLNERNFFPSLLFTSHIGLQQRRNTFLDLNHPYEELLLRYHAGAKRKLKKASSCHFKTDTSSAVKEVIDLYKKHYQTQDDVVSHYDFTNMIALLTHELSAQTKTYILSFPDGEPAAFYLLLFDDNYVYWLIGGSTDRGKKANAFYYMTDWVIREFANTKRTFRFEGSDHEGIHFFNGQFGGETVLYPRLKVNNLPWPIRYLK